jgi:glucose/mannose-6-phosphate isomerase
MDGIDEEVLADEDQLLGRDAGRLLWALARSGAQVRRAGETVGEFELDRLVGDRPRAVLLVGDPPARAAVRLAARVLGRSAAVTVWSGAELPKWAGPSDAVLAASVDGYHPRVTNLLEQAARRGLSRAVVAPLGSPVAQAAGRASAAALPADVHPRAALWPLVVPLLQAGAALELTDATPATLAGIADALDAGAEAYRPASDVFTNPAKSLALELGETLPLLVGVGALGGVAARVFADALRLYAGSPAITLTVPDDVATAAALLSGRVAGTAHDLFRDRVDEVELRPRLVVVGVDSQPEVGAEPAGEFGSEERAARSAVATLEQLAAATDVRSSTLDLAIDTHNSPPLPGLAAATATAMFTASYLALASGIDPSAPRPGELL